MSRNSGGTYTLPAGTPFVTGTVINSTVVNAVNTDIATALTQSIASTGVTTPTANLPMGTFRHTGVGNATAQACYGSVTDIQNGSLVTLASVAGTNTITANAPFTVAAYALGQSFRFIPANTNSGATTVNISTLGAKNLLINGAACTGGELVQNVPAEIFYDGVQFNVVGTGSLTTRTGAETLTNKTLTSPTINTPTITNPTITGYTETEVTATGSAFSPSLSAGTIFVYTTNANTTITLPAPVAGKSFTVDIIYGGAHTVTWAVTSGTLLWPSAVAPTATSSTGKRDSFAFKSADTSHTHGSTIALNYSA